jgi:hypothetical protein
VAVRSQERGGGGGGEEGEGVVAVVLRGKGQGGGKGGRRFLFLDVVNNKLFMLLSWTFFHDIYQNCFASNSYYTIYRQVPYMFANYR